MVWKVILCACCLAIFTSGEVQAATYTTYDGNISTTYIDMFDGMSIPMGDDYVVFRGTQYQYYLFYGDIELVGSSFSGSGTLVTITQETNSGYGSYYSINTTEDNNFLLNASDKVVYSSLGSYPSMYDEDYYFQGIILLLLAIIVISNIIRPIFAFNLRFRNGGVAS